MITDFWASEIVNSITLACFFWHLFFGRSYFLFGITLSPYQLAKKIYSFSGTIILISNNSSNLKITCSLQLLTGMDGPYNPLGIWANLIVVIQGFFSLLLTALLTVCAHTRSGFRGSADLFFRVSSMHGFHGPPQELYLPRMFWFPHSMEFLRLCFALQMNVPRTSWKRRLECSSCEMKF